MKLEEIIAKDICDLNRFDTPKHFDMKDLTEKEKKIIFNVLSKYVPYSVWIKEWQKQIGASE